MPKPPSTATTTTSTSTSTSTPTSSTTSHAANHSVEIQTGNKKESTFQASRIVQWFLHWISRDKDLTEGWKRINKEVNLPYVSPEKKSRGLSGLLREWIWIKSSASVVFAGPRGVGKRFLVNTLLETTAQDLHNNTPTSKPGLQDNLASLEATHSLESEFCLVSDNPYEMTDSSTTTSMDSSEFVIDQIAADTFFNNYNWEGEQSSSGETAQYCISGRVSVDDIRPYLLPQRIEFPHITVMKYGRIPEAVITFLSPEDLAASLWELCLEAHGLKTLDADYKQFLQWRFTMITGKLPTPTRLLSIPSQQFFVNSLRPEIAHLLGKKARYRGNGASLPKDRIYVREMIKQAFGIWPFFIESLSIKFPCGLLDGNREVVITDCEIWEPLITARCLNAMHGANLLILSVDGKGITQDFATMIKSAYYLQKVIIAPQNHRVATIELNDPRPLDSMAEWGTGPAKDDPVTQLFSQSVHESCELHKLALRLQLQHLFEATPLPPPMDYKIASPLIEQALASITMIPVWPLLYKSVCLQPLLQRAAEVRSKTGVTTLACYIQNAILSQCSHDIREFGHSWMLRFNSTLQSKASPLVNKLQYKDWEKRLKLEMEIQARAEQELTSSAPSNTAAAPGSPPPGKVDSKHSSIPSDASDPEKLMTAFQQVLHISSQDRTITTFAFMQPDQLLSSFEEKISQWKRDLKEYFSTPQFQYLLQSSAQQCTAKAEASWPQFRDKYLRTKEACQALIALEFKGEPVGIEVTRLFFENLLHFTHEVWQTYITYTLPNKEQDILKLTGHALAQCEYIIEHAHISPMEHYQFKQFLLQCQEVCLCTINTRMGHIRKLISMPIMSESLVKSCQEQLTFLFKQLVPVSSNPQYFQEVMKSSFEATSSNAAKAVHATFLKTIALVDVHLHSTEKQLIHVLRCLISSPVLNQTNKSNANSNRTQLNTQHCNPTAPATTSDAITLASGGLSISDSEQHNYTKDLLNNKIPLKMNQNQVQQFIQQLANRGLQIYGVTPDSNSQFRAFAQHVYHTEEAHAIVRLLVLAEVLSNEEKYLDLIKSSDFQIYVNSLTRDGVPGDHVTLAAFANFVCKDLFLYVPVLPQPVRIPAQRVAGRGGPALHLALLPGNIYQPLLWEDSENGDNKQKKRFMRERNESIHGGGGPVKIPSLKDLCVSACAQNICAMPHLNPGMIPEEIIQAILSSVIQFFDIEMDFDVVLHKLLNPYIFVLDLSTCTHISNYSMLEISKACPRLQRLNLSNCHKVTTEGLCDIVSACSDLCELNIQGCQLVADQAILTLCTCCTSCTSLNINGCSKISSGVFPSLSGLPLQKLEAADLSQLAMVPQLTTLSSLDLSNCPNVTDSSLSFLEKCTGLISLKLQNNKLLTDQTCAKILASCTALQILDLSGCDHIHNLTTKSLLNCTRLSVLSLSNCNVETEGFSVLMQLPPSQQTPAVSMPPPSSVQSPVGSPICSPPSSPLVARSITTHKPPHKFDCMTSLDVSGCTKISSAVLEALAESCGFLENLNISSCSATTDQSIISAARLMPLTHISVGRCNVSDSALVELMRECSCDLQEFIAPGCQGIADSVLGAIASSCPNLKTLDLSQCDCITETALCEIFTHCKNLTSVTLEECTNAVNDNTVLVISEHCHKLANLSIGYCTSLTDKALSHLCNLQSHIPATLEHLDVSHCRNLSPLVLCGCLQHLGHLRSFSARGSRISTESIVMPILPSDSAEHNNNKQATFVNPAPPTTSTPTIFHSVPATATTASPDLIPNFASSTAKRTQSHSRGWLQLRSINLSWSRNLRDEAVAAVAAWCPLLESCDLSRCPYITDVSIQQLHSACPCLKRLNITACKNISSQVVRTLTYAGVSILR
ncbi:leucine Rich Repeat family protein [Pelomyxa schiedti]|nr:leucine Rich Repeat family protein [Pelomyxa schiedti]